MSSTGVSKWIAGPTSSELMEAEQFYDDVVARVLGTDYHARIARYKGHRAGNCNPDTCEYRH